MRLLVHGDGDSTRGLGHLVRMLGVALELPSSVEVHFATNNVGIAQKVLAQMRTWFDREVLIQDLKTPSNSSWDEALPLTFDAILKLLEQSPRFDALITDGKYPWSREQTQKFRSLTRMAMVDNTTPARFEADLIIYPTAHASTKMTAGLDPLKLRTGLEWTWIHPGARFVGKEVPKKYDIVVSMGGADPNRLTLAAMDAIEHTQQFASKAVVVGEAFKHKKEVLEIASKYKGWTVVEGGPAGQKAIRESRLALVAFGLTLYECYAMQVPAWIVGHDRDALEDAKVLVSRHPDLGILVDLKSLPIERARTMPSCVKNSELGNLSLKLFQELKA